MVYFVPGREVFSKGNKKKRKKKKKNGLRLAPDLVVSNKYHRYNLMILAALFATCPINDYDYANFSLFDCSGVDIN